MPLHSWLRPHRYVPSLHHVDPAELRSRGLRAALLDLDNTLVPWTEQELEPNVEAWVARAREAGLRICIVSNTRVESRIQRIARRLGVPYLSRARKPRRRALRLALGLLGTRPEETAVIGDQVFTDVVAGNRLGAYTVLCVPMPGREFPGAVLIRRLERFVLRSLALEPSAPSACPPDGPGQEAH